MSETLIHDVGEADFEARVVERSRELPVVVDFWAEWCGPCRSLGPALESAVSARAGEVELAKVDVDSNQNLSRSFGIQGIPAVKAFRDGKVVAEFTGAQPPAQIEAFLDKLVPSKADRLTASGDEESLREALAADPSHSGALVAHARVLIGRGDDAGARELLERAPGDFTAQGLLARLDLSDSTTRATDEELEHALAAWDEGAAGPALELMQKVIAAETDPDRVDLLRRLMVSMFTELGSDPLASEHRRRLSAALN